MKAWKQPLKVFLVCLLLGDLLVFSTYAARLSTAELGHSFGVDAVKIEVQGTQPEKDVLLPGSSVPLRFLIRENGADCYVRCRAEYRANPSSEQGFKVVPVDFAGMLDPELWEVAADGFAYYKPVLQRGSSVFLEETVSDVFAGQAGSFAHVLTVEAVQARHMDPDYSAASPWGGIQVHDYEGQEVVFWQGSGNDPYSLSYSTSEGFSVSDRGLFGSFATMVPGDERSGKVVLRNTGGKTAQMLFWVALPEEDSAAVLRESARLKVSVSSGFGEKVLFEGSLQQACASEKLKLGELGAGQSRELAFTLSLPVSLGNEAAAQWGNMVFRFEAQPIDDPGSQGDGGSGGAGFEPEGGSGGLSGDGNGLQEDGDSGSGDPGANGTATTEASSQAGGSVAKKALAKTRDFLSPIIPGLTTVACLSGFAACIAWMRGRYGFRRFRKRGGGLFL